MGWSQCRTGHLSYYARSQLVQGRRCLSVTTPLVAAIAAELRPPQGWAEQPSATPGVASHLSQLGEVLDEADSTDSAQIVAAILEELAISDFSSSDELKILSGSDHTISKPP